MSIECDCVEQEQRCLKCWYFFIVIGMLAYVAGTLFIPADFPLGMVGEGGWTGLVHLFSLGFMIVNIVAAWAIVKGYDRMMLLRPTEEKIWLEKIRNSFATGLGFAAAFRFFIYFMWIIGFQF